MVTPHERGPAESGAGRKPAERRRVEIVHESLLTNWPRLVGWQTQDADGARVRDELRQAARLWEEHDRADDRLWTGTAFREFQLWRERYPGGLTALEEVFAAAMTARALRARRRRRIAVAAVIGLLSTVLAFVTVLRQQAVGEKRRAEQAALHSEAQKLLALGQNQLDSYPTAALAYATKSLEIADSIAGRRFALKALERGPVAFLLPLPGLSWGTLSFSPDGRWLAAGAVDSRISIVSASGGLPIEIRKLDNMAMWRDLAFGPTNDWLATRAFFDAITVWSVPGAELLRTIVPPEPGFIVQRAGQIWSLSNGSSHLRRWSPFDGAQIDLGSVGPRSASALSPFDVDPTGAWLAVPDGRDVVVLPVDALNSVERRLIGSHSAEVKRVFLGLGPRGALASIDTTKTVRIWQIERKALRLRREIRGEPTEALQGFDRTGSRIATSNPSRREIRIWDLSAPPEEEPRTLRWGTSETYLVLPSVFAPAGGDWLAALNQSQLSFWPLSRGDAHVLRGHQLAVNQIRVSPAGWIASASQDGTARIWPQGDESGGRSRILLDSNSSIFALALDPLAKRVVTADAGVDAPFLLHDADGLGPPRQLEYFWSAPGAAAFDRSGLRVAIGNGFFSGPNESIVIRVWETGGGAVVRDIHRQSSGPGAPKSGYDGGVVDLEFAPDGALYSAGWGGVRRWNLESGESEVVVEGEWTQMDLSDDGRSLLTSTGPVASPSSGPAAFHDLISHTSRALSSHGNQVVCVALDPAATVAVTGSADGTIRVGRVTGEEPHLLFGHDGIVTSVAVSPDGRWIASGGADGTVRRWPMPDLSRPPLQTLPYDQLLAKLHSLTNLRVVEDAASPNGYKLDIGPFPGWETVPEW